MGQCKWCEKKGLFLKITENGLCRQCDIVVVSKVVQHHKHFNESFHLIESSQNIDTMVSRFDYMTQLMEDLLPYEQKGIPTINPRPSEFLADVDENRDEVIIDGLNREFEKLKKKIAGMKTERGKRNNLEKFKEMIANYSEQLHDLKLVKPIFYAVNEYEKVYLSGFTGS